MHVFFPQYCQKLCIAHSCILIMNSPSETLICLRCRTTQTSSQMLTQTSSCSLCIAKLSKSPTEYQIIRGCFISCNHDYNKTNLLPLKWRCQLSDRVDSVTMVEKLKCELYLHTWKSDFENFTTHSGVFRNFQLKFSLSRFMLKQQPACHIIQKKCVFSRLFV